MDTGPKAKGAFFQKLARQRREPAQEPAPEPAQESGAEAPNRKGQLPSWFRTKLDHARREEPAEVAARVQKSAGTPKDLETFENDRGASKARVLRYPLDHVHGDWRLDWIGDRAHELDRLGCDPALADMDLARSIYLDIETTGLSGGSGTIPFMVALGTFRDDHFELWQGFLDGPEEEASMLEEVSQRVAACDSVVSFFGKSFDRHRLEDKMRVHGVEPPFERPHLDLFHPLKRLYRGAYPDMRLGTLERALCAVQRVDDLPGSFAPAAWYDYLAGRAHRLEAVFEHNRDDVLSLVTLAAHLRCSIAERRPDGEELEGYACARARGLAQLFANERDFERGLAWTDRALIRAEDDTNELRTLRADLLRLSGRHEEALAAYEEVRGAGNEQASVNALLQIAKLCEHRLRDFVRAKEAAQLARSLARDHLTGTARRRALDESVQRIARLDTKLTRRARD